MGSDHLCKKVQDADLNGTGGGSLFLKPAFFFHFLKNFGVDRGFSLFFVGRLFVLGVVHWFYGRVVGYWRRFGVGAVFGCFIFKRQPF